MTDKTKIMFYKAKIIQLSFPNSILVCELERSSLAALVSFNSIFKNTGALDKLVISEIE